MVTIDMGHVDVDDVTYSLGAPDVSVLGGFISR